MRVFLSICLVFLITSCNAENGIVTVSIDEDFSEIQDPRERWQAYQLSDYQIVQQRICECLGLEYTTLIIADSVQKISYDSKRTDEYDEFALRNAITIDQAFDLIEEYGDIAASISVKYHPKFGYPERLFIDINEMTADEEIIYEIRDLKKIKD
ncbi:DUF6174 domain-containing protein [Gracilimonas sp. BCB1]|uniref:DUF6174 domain-containing protein n=1 Tax=Gracilimonas sp. BCB1 TaxID=3152362 RepID=UPI0032D9924F